MIIINSTEKSTCDLTLGDHGESVQFNGDPVWSLAIHDGEVHLSLLAKNNDDTLSKIGAVGHLPHYVHNVFKSENITSDTPIMGKSVSWKLGVTQTTTVSDKTDVPVGPIEIYPGYSEKADLLRLITDTLDRDTVVNRLQRYYKQVDDIRFAIWQNHDEDTHPTEVIDPVFRVIHEVLP